jgi:methylthioribose-1-phosphate isomerase
LVTGIITEKGILTPPFESNTELFIGEQKLS